MAQPPIRVGEGGTAVAGPDAARAVGDALKLREHLRDREESSRKREAAVMEAEKALLERERKVKERERRVAGRERAVDEEFERLRERERRFDLERAKK